MTTNESVINVGEKVYDTNHTLANGERVSIEYTVTHVSSNSFKTDDGKRWVIGKYTYRTAKNSFKEWGSGDSYRGRYIRTYAGEDERILTMDDVKRENTAFYEDQREVENDQLRSTLRTIGVSRAVTATLRRGAGRWDTTAKLKSLREALATDEEREQYIVALERSAAEAYRTINDQISSFASMGKRLQESIEREYGKLS